MKSVLKKKVICVCFFFSFSHASRVLS